jgi:hypothetical protein
MKPKRDYKIIAGRFAVVALPIVGTSGVDYLIGDWLFWLLMLLAVICGVAFWWFAFGDPKTGRK